MKNLSPEIALLARSQQIDMTDRIICQTLMPVPSIFTRRPAAPSAN